MIKKLSPTVFLRVALGITICGHGIMKVIGGPVFWQTLGGLPPFVPDVAQLQLALGIVAMLIELVGGVFLVVNYRVREAALAIVAVMLVAFSYHLPSVKDFSSLMRNTWPLELALVYVAIAMMHPAKKSS